MTLFNTTQSLVCCLEYLVLFSVLVLFASRSIPLHPIPSRPALAGAASECRHSSVGRGRRRWAAASAAAVSPAKVELRRCDTGLIRRWPTRPRPVHNPSQPPLRQSATAGFPGAPTGAAKYDSGAVGDGTDPLAGRRAAAGLTPAPAPRGRAVGAEGGPEVYGGGLVVYGGGLVVFGDGM